MARRSGLLAIVLLLTGLATGCSKPTASSSDFPFTGSWTGRYTDYLLINMNLNEPVTVVFEITVTANGSAEASGQKEIGGFRDIITMDLTIMPDGSVYGEGDYALHYYGVNLLAAHGTVLGQFEDRSDTGWGILSLEIDGLPHHLPWTVTRQ